MRHLLHTTLLLLLATTCPAQDIAPLVNAKGELILFDAGRFERLAPTAPRQMHVLGGRLLFEDQQGRLLLYTERGTAVKRIAEPGTFREVSCQGGRAAFRQGDALMAVLHDRVVQLCPRAGRFTVSDSLIVFHDLDAGLLQVHWKGAFHTLAAVGGDGGRPQWESGPNTVAFFDKAARRLHLFHRGHTRVLVEGTDVGRAAAGLDLVAFQGVDDGGFSIFHNGRVMPVSFSPAFRFAAGRGMVGFVDHGGRLRAYADGHFATLCDSIPTSWNVHDSLLVFIEGNRLKTLYEGRPVVIEPYVPEQWVASGAAVYYTDLNRTLHRYRDGRRERLFREAGITALEVFGNAVRFQGADGRYHVWWKGRVYSY